MQSAPNFHKLQKQFTTKKLSNALVMQSASRLMNRRTLERIKAIVNGEMDAEKKEESEKKTKEPKAKKESAKKK
jgi:hypothetical protein